MQALKFFITGHKGFETLLFHEIRRILADTEATISKRYGGVEVSGEIDAAYRVCLHSRLANRVFYELFQAEVKDENRLYDEFRQFEWENHLTPDNSIAISASLSRSKLTHTQFVALKAKDAIVDRFRDLSGNRPRVERHQPDVQVHINIHQNQASISLDLSGESLHRRGYRLEHGGAPLKEHLAAALLCQAGWEQGGSGERRMVDPMCGSGTFAIEAAMMSAGIAPGLMREYFGFKGWLAHDAEAWENLLVEARSSIRLESCADILASDYDSRVLDIARANAARAGVSELIEFTHQQLADFELAAFDGETLVVSNPPYGKRLEAEQGLGQLYSDLGTALRGLQPARLGIISANPDLLHRLKLKRISRKNVRNGPLDCLFALFDAVDTVDPVLSVEATAPAVAVDDQAGQALRNRLLKNSRHLQRWARRNNIDCYRLYDADLPEFAFALDRYRSEIAPEIEWFHLQEYRAPDTIDPEIAEHRIKLATEVVKQLFAIADQQIFCKTRSRQRGTGQYQKLDSQNEYYQVREGAASLLINLSDYLDSGLFLDHRVTRERVYQCARDKTVLNLFCYTAAVGVQAGLGGASSVLNVDLSPSYLKWAQENHALNGLTDEDRYQFLRADIIELLHNPGHYSLTSGYDLIFLDPPSFSNSRKMQQTLDIQRDHAELIRLSMDLLAPNGLLMFSTNRRGFKLDKAVQSNWDTADISHQTIPEDFKRNQKIHRCWEIRNKP